MTFATAAQAAELLINGGFEDGVYTSAGNSSQTSVPNGWETTAGYDLNPSFNRVLPTHVNSGAAALQLGNVENQIPATLTQSFSDFIGVLYTVSFYVFANGGDASAFLTVSAGEQQAKLTDYTSFTPGFVLQSLTFLGSGSDTLVISANNTPAFWYVDDVSVSGETREGETPLPAALWTMLSGLTGLGIVAHRRKAVA